MSKARGCLTKVNGRHTLDDISWLFLPVICLLLQKLKLKTVQTTRPAAVPSHSLNETAA